MTEQADRAARAQAETMYAADRASQALGITVSAVAVGRATATMRVRDDMVNGHDIAHGGYVFLLADTAFAFACNTHGPATVARSGDITFLSPVAAGEDLVAVAEERVLSGRNGIYHVTVRRASGEVVAEFRGSSRALDRRPEG